MYIYFSTIDMKMISITFKRIKKKSAFLQFGCKYDHQDSDPPLKLSWAATFNWKSVKKALSTFLEKKVAKEMQTLQ